MRILRHRVLARSILRLSAVVALSLLSLEFLSSCGNSEAHGLSRSDSEGSGSFGDTEAQFDVPTDITPIVTTAPSFLAHPYLYYDKRDSSALQQARDTGHERGKIFQIIKAEVDKQGTTCPSHGISAYGLCFVVTGNTSYAKSVHNALRSLASKADWEAVRDRKHAAALMYFATGFDLCYDYLKKQSDFQKLRDKLALETFKMFEAATGNYNSEWKNWWRHTYSQNHFHRNVAAMTMGALALKFEGNQLSKFSQSDVNKWIAAAKEEWTKNHYALSRIVDGSWFEGTQYEETTIGADMPHPLYMLKRIEGLDLLSVNPWLRMVPVYWIYNTNPENPRARIAAYGDSGTSWSRRNGLLSTLRLCARIFGDSQAQWAADVVAKASGRQPTFTDLLRIHCAVQELFYYDDSVTSKSPEGRWDASWHAKDLEVAFMRSSLSKGGLNSALKCGAYGGHALFEAAKANYKWKDTLWIPAGYPVGGSQGMYPQDLSLSPAHCHPDNNGFYIVMDGIYLAPEGGGYDAKHNTPWGRFTSSHNSITVDGRGQIGEGHVQPSWGNDRKEFFMSDGTIPLFAPTKNFDLSIGDATRSYPRSLGLKEFRRHFFFLKPDYFVVFDSLDAESAKSYDWYCHFMEDATFEGRWVKGHAAGDYALGINVVSPTNYSRQTGIRGAGPEYGYLGDKDKELHFVRLGLTGKAQARFITVLYPTFLSTWAKRPTIEKISETTTAAGVRVRHSSGAEDAILCVYGTSSSVKIGEFEVDGVGASVRQDSSGRLLSIYLADGRSLKQGGKSLVQINSDATSFEASYLGSDVMVTGRSIHGFKLYAPEAETLTVNGQDVAFSRDGDWITTEE